MLRNDTRRYDELEEKVVLSKDEFVFDKEGVTNCLRDIPAPEMKRIPLEGSDGKKMEVFGQIYNGSRPEYCLSNFFIKKVTFFITELTFFWQIFWRITFFIKIAPKNISKPSAK